jgi:hypothetical protein
MTSQAGDLDVLNAFGLAIGIGLSFCRLEIATVLKTVGDDKSIRTMVGASSERLGMPDEG